MSTTIKNILIKINAKFLITFHFLDKKSKTRNNGKIKNIKGRLANTIFYLYLINISLSTVRMAYSTTKLKNHNLSKLLKKQLPYKFIRTKVNIHNYRIKPAEYMTIDLIKSNHNHLITYSFHSLISLFAGERYLCLFCF